MGDVVRIMETRPLSKQKRWRVVEVISKAEVVEVKPEEIA
jgi:small subunit ribosomal protein S17